MPHAAITHSGDDGFLFELGSVSAGELHALASAARATSGVRAAVIGQSSLLVLARAPGYLPQIREAVLAILAHGVGETSPERIETHEIAVDFGDEHAPDLGLLLERASIDRDALIDRIASLDFRARFLGFLPGFAYLEGWPEEWSLSRRAGARERVAAGSLGVAGTMAGIYPDESPGGWNLIGRTAARLWDPEAARPNLIAPGDVVRIVPGAYEHQAAHRNVRHHLRDEPVAEVISPGMTTIVAGLPDDQRWEFGIAPGGAFDTVAAVNANRLVRNRDGASVLECASVGSKLRFLCDATIAITGARAAATCDGRTMTMNAPVGVAAGEIVSLGAFREGFRVVVAVRGGILDPAPRWSARPHRLSSGETLFGAGLAEERKPLSPAASDDRYVLRALPGPHRVDLGLLQRVVGRDWTVTAALDRTGIRLVSGPPPAELPATLPSCGMHFGSVQWHPGGELVIMGPDHPLTGGYLQPVTIVRSELWKLARLAPGESVRVMCLDLNLRAGG